MDKTLAGLLGAVSALALASPSHAAATTNDLESAMSASSYADLLQPIPNARALLQVAAAQDAQEPGFDAGAVEQVQYHHHHHHHHHHRWHRRWWHRHYHPPVVVIRPGV
jgi:hypothetical protein